MSDRLIFLGTGTPSPLVHRAASSYLLEVEGRRFLIDCGPGAVRRLIEAKIPLTSVSHLFLTHLHYDHCVDFACFSLIRWDQSNGKIPDLQVYGPQPVERM